MMRRFGRELTAQEARILYVLDTEPELLLYNEFWLEEQKQFPWLQTLFTAAAVYAASEVLAGEQVPIITDPVERMAREAAFDLIKGITDTTRAGLSDSLSQWFAGGLTRQQIEDKIGLLFTPERASRIAITESTRLVAQGKLAGARELEQLGFRVQARFIQNSNYPTCQCAELRNTIVDLNDPSVHPPIHPNCNCEIVLEFLDATDKTLTAEDVEGIARKVYAEMAA